MEETQTAQMNGANFRTQKPRPQHALNGNLGSLCGILRNRLGPAESAAEHPVTCPKCKKAMGR